MNLKDYKVQPDEGLYEKIEHRLKVRRMARVWSAVAGVVAVCAVVVAMMTRSTVENIVGQSTVAEKVIQGVAVQEEDRLFRQSQATATSPLPGSAGDMACDRSRANIGEELVSVSRATESIDKEDNSVSISAPKLVEVDSRRVDGVCKNEAVAPVVPAEPTEATGTVDAIGQPVVSISSADEEQPEAETSATVKAGATPVHIDNLIWAPNVIVPNGDEIDNRSFKLKFSSTVTHFHIHIYNRGGRLVFTSTSSSFEWDGTAHGSALPQGTYVWVAQFRDTAGHPREEKGTVTIIR